MFLNNISSWTTGPIQNNFTELSLKIHFTKIAQMVPLYWRKGPPEL